MWHLRCLSETAWNYYCDWESWSVKVRKLLSSCSRTIFSRNTHLHVFRTMPAKMQHHVDFYSGNVLHTLSSCWTQWRMDYTEKICVASWQMSSCGKLDWNLWCFKCHIRAGPKSMINWCYFLSSLTVERVRVFWIFLVRKGPNLFVSLSKNLLQESIISVYCIICLVLLGHLTQKLQVERGPSLDSARHLSDGESNIRNGNAP